MFAKPIERDIKGVIKVGQADNENIKQELEEYVVTRELQKHFADFFSSYKKGINGHTDKMGVWISGFFGSGKSHFLKILSYLLENKEVSGKRAIDYFIDDKKIIDPMVLADMKLAASVPTDVILFNIDSKSEMVGKGSKDAIVSVFLKVFNEMQGFCGTIPALADLERQLTEQGLYDNFKEQFEDEFGKSWLESRNKFDFIQDTIVDVLVDMDFMSESAARNWCEKAIEPYQISIESFAEMVKEYLDKKGNNHHLVFLVDEIGQYIGDDSNLMLNLQTVAEDLGTACHGKAWIIVTSQQDIDTITKIKGNDFSKIQGRFDTRLSLSSANVDEVIKKRILDKTMTAEQTLRLLYEQKSTIIKNLIVFNDGVEKKLYADEHDFALVYPFIPYQFNLLASVLTSIRTHGASGKHLSEGERSMIALFKESAMKLMDQEHGALIPFNVFYDALHQFLDHSHKGVISRAADTNLINPDHEDDNFNVNVLKTLFMIKYVKEITANAENITSLMISDIDTDRIELKKDVEEALKILVRQTLVQKNGDHYVFLTDEEQEINREIQNQQVEMADVINKVSEIIFEDIFNDKKYRYPEHNGRYNFAFNQIVDDRFYKSNQNDIGVRILTPNSDYGDEETALRMMSGQGKEVLVVLSNDPAFLNELKSALQIEKYLRRTPSNKLAKFDQIKEAKRIEMRERNGNAKLFLEESMKHAAIYVNGDRAQIGAKEVTSRINEALGRLVETVYHKLSYINGAKDEADIRALFKKSNDNSFALNEVDEVNRLALEDMLSFIAANSSMHTKTSMKSLLDRFMKAPYGFVEDDVEWLVANLFKNSEISFTLNGAAITMLNKSEEEIIRYITKKEYVERLLIERRQATPKPQKDAVRIVMKELFEVSSISEDDDALMQSFQGYRKSLEEELKEIERLYSAQNYPGENIVMNGKKLLRTIAQTQSATEFFNKVYTMRDDLLDFAEDIEPIKTFFKGEQKKIFDDSLSLVKRYDDSKSFIVDDQVEETARDIKVILKQTKPYYDIPKLPDLNQQFREAYVAVFNRMEKPILNAIADARARVFEVLDTKSYKEELKDRYLSRFNELHEKATKCENVATLQNVKIEADALKVRFLNEMTKKDEKMVEDQVKEDKSSQGYVETPKPTKNISLKSVSLSSSWQIKTEQDIDKHIEELRKRIREQFEPGEILNVEL